MIANQRPGFRGIVLVTLILSLTIVSSRLRADSGNCGGQAITLPFTDVAGSVFFCQIAEAYFSGLTFGTTDTTYSPAATVTREQMAAFTTRTLDETLKRGRGRAALNQWWTTTPHYDINLGTTLISGFPVQVVSDGVDLWVSNHLNNVSRVRASDGKLLETWMAPTATSGVLVAMSRIFLTAPLIDSGRLYMIDPSQQPETPTTISDSLGKGARAIAFDGARIWTANIVIGQLGSISIITPGPQLPWDVTTITTDFDAPLGILFDGTNMWVVDTGDNALKKLDSIGNVILQVSVPFPGGSNFPAFDGTNIWVPHNPNGASGGITIVRASTGQVVARLTGNGLNQPTSITFDGERMLVTNVEGDSVSLWRATDLTPLGSFSLGSNVEVAGACSDGLNFWIPIANPGRLARF